MTDGNTYAINKYLNDREARIEELEAKLSKSEALLAKAVEALEGLVELHDLSTNEINPKTVLECAYTTLAELTGDTP